MLFTNISLFINLQFWCFGWKRTGFMFHSEGGLMRFEHPMNMVKAMPRVDSQGVICGANFKVDKFTRINSMPRTGSAANWSQWDTQMHEAA